MMSPEVCYARPLGGNVTLPQNKINNKRGGKKKVTKKILAVIGLRC